MNAQDCRELQFKNIIFDIEKVIKHEVENGSDSCIFYEKLWRHYKRRDEVLEYFRNLGFIVYPDLNTSRIEIKW